MRLTARILIVFALVAVSLPLFAQDSPAHPRYRWKDTQGGLHYTDTLPSEALQNGYDVVDGHGFVVKHVERALTAEERKTGAATAAAQATANQHAQEQARVDQQLLVAYASEQDLVVAQKAKLEAIDQTIQNVQLSQSDQEKNLSEQLAHAASLENNGKPVPALVQQQIETLRKNIEAQKAFVGRKQQERTAAAQKSEEEMAHYRELRAKQPGPAHP
jgi:hypothetical protein